MNEFRYDWERRYLHVNYSQSLEKGHEPANPCPDVYWFPGKIYNSPDLSK